MEPPSPPAEASTRAASPHVLFLRGLLALPRGGRFLLAHRPLLRLAVVPILVSIGVFSLAIGLAIHYYGGLLGAVTRWLEMAPPEHWYLWIVLGLAKVGKLLVGLVLAVVLAAVGLLSATVVGNLVASHFNDALSARVEEFLIGPAAPEEPGGGVRAIARDARYALGGEARKLVLFVVAEAALLSLNLLVPVAGTALFAVLNTLFAVLFAALEYLDYPMSRRRISFREKGSFLRNHLASSLGLGLGIFLTFFVPGLNFLCMPLAVTGATLLYCDLQAKGPRT